MTVLDTHPLSQTPMPPAPLRCSSDSQPSVSLVGHDELDESMETSNEESLSGKFKRSDVEKAKGNKHTREGSLPKKHVPATSAPMRGRRKSRWKLKFHHQALPPEYLKHYKQQEKKRKLTETKRVVVDKIKAKKQTKTSIEPDLLPVEAILRQDGDGIEDGFPNAESLQQFCSDTDELKTDVSRLDGLWPTPIMDEGFPHLNIDLSQNKAFLENLLSNQIEINRVDRPGKTVHSAKPVKPKKVKAIPPSGRIMNYSDLPYMGEITLDGIKPRRGRKPKKADICHLIYKNYGQIFPGAPNSVLEEATQKVTKWKQSSARGTPSTSLSHSNKPYHPQAESPLPTVSGLINHTEVQNRIINSLLERRLTQEIRNKAETSSKGEDGPLQEPLNLCLRDLQSLKIKLSRKHGNIYEAKSPEVLTKSEVDVKKEVINVESDDESSVDDSDLAPFNLVTTELRESSDDDSCLSLGSQVTLSKVNDKGLERDLPAVSPPDPTMYWPGNNYFPMGNYPPMPLLPEMYYQKLNELKARQSEKQTTKNVKIKSPTKRLSQKQSSSSSQVMAKRKRSAIFIPPVPAENTSNPTTEVSICKFKFTGGAKPSLQEKKMLSVDSGGNFRYYSGTGDKSMRGYEYFPRESLQQCQENTGCSPSGVFLTASALGSGEKIPEDVGHSGFFDPSFPFQLPNAIPPTKQKSKKQDHSPGNFSVLREQLNDSLGEDDDDDSDNSQNTSPSPALDVQRDEGSEDVPQRRARRSRKSLAREKLEQTFKEKGFLIQTQQLESAEGATYCKFRQLRKFTRYLFRSWKDYLPGNVRDLSMDAGVCQPTESPPVKLEEGDS